MCTGALLVTPANSGCLWHLLISPVCVCYDVFVMALREDWLLGLAAGNKSALHGLRPGILDCVTSFKCGVLLRRKSSLRSGEIRRIYYPTMGWQNTKEPAHTKALRFSFF